MKAIVRTATDADAEACLEIYRPFVERTSVSFEEVTPTIQDFRLRMAKSLSHWSWLVATVEGRIAGYAYGGPHRERAAYRYSVEVSAYLDPAYHRRGIGAALYDELFTRLLELGYRNAYAGITLPNEASLALHDRLGFEPIGTFKSVGYKFGVWHDVAWMHLPL